MQEAVSTLPRGARRRELLTAGAFTALTGIAAAVIARPDTPAAGPVSAPHPDAELIAECERFLELERKVVATHKAVPHVEDVGPEAVYAAEAVAEKTVERIEGMQDAIVKRMHGLHALTLEGHRMRARVLFAFCPDMPEESESSGYREDQLTWLLVRDLVAEVDHG